MLNHNRKAITSLSLVHHVFHSPAAFFSVSLPFSSDIKNSETLDKTINYVSALIKKPNWEKNSILKSLVSHMNPHVASQVISLQGTDTDLCVRFFKWVCKQSTYCYDLERRIQLLNLVVSSNLYGVAHKVIIVLIKECGNSENEILKLMGILDELRETGFRLNYPCYSSLLMSLAKLDFGFLAYMTYRRMEADGFIVGMIDYKTIINALCKNVLVEAAEMFLCKVLKVGFKLDTHICTSLLLGYCRECNLEEALKLFDVMSEEDGCAPNSVSYSILIHGLCEMGRLEEAFCLKNLMSEKGSQPSTRTYTVLIKAVCDKGLIDKALSLLDEMVARGCKPNVHTYTILIDKLCEEGNIEEANGMYRKMVKDGLLPSIITYNALINGYCKEGRIIPAFELLSMMEKRNCKPNVRTYNELMDGLCRVRKPYKAIFLLKRMVDNGLLPDIVSYNVMINGFCKEGHLAMAYKLFSSMNTLGLDPDCLSFTAISDVLCKQGKPELASAFLGLMVKKGVCPDEVIFTTLIDGFCKVGKTKDGLMLLETLIKTTCLKTPHSLNVFLDVLSKACKLKEEYAMLGKIIKFGLVPSVVSYTILVDGLIRSGDITGSLKMIELMKQAGCSPNVYTYTIVINGLCQFGRIEEAQELLSAMPELGVSPNHITYTVLVKAYVNAGSLDRALETVRIMVRNGCKLNNRIYSALLQGFVLSQKTIDASKQNDENALLDNVLREINLENIYLLQNKIEEFGGYNGDLCNFLVVGLCKAGRADEAYDLILTVLNRHLFPDKALDTIIGCYYRQKKYDKCLKLISLVLRRGFVPGFESFCLVIQSLQDFGNSRQAQRLIDELLSSSGVLEKNAALPYIEFLLKGDEVGESSEIMNVVNQVHYREKPII